MVYAALDRIGRPLYVGQTTNLERRHAAHRSASGWFSDAAVWTWVVADEDIHERRHHEDIAIEHIHPTFNIHRKSGFGISSADAERRRKYLATPLRRNRALYRWIDAVLARDLRRQCWK